MEKNILIKKYDRALKRINVVLLFSLFVNVVIFACLKYFEQERLRWMLSSYHPIHMSFFFYFMMDSYGILSIIGTIIAFIILLSCISITIQVNKKYKKIFAVNLLQKEYDVVKNKKLNYFMIITLLDFIIILHIVLFSLNFIDYLF